MTTKSRLNPNNNSLATLKSLEKKGILFRRKVGLRHIIKPDGTVQSNGYDIGFDPNNFDLSNFYPGLGQVRGAVVQYENARADLTATLGLEGWEGHCLDVGSHFPPNPWQNDF